MAKTTMTSKQITVLLERRHQPPEWAYLTELRNQTGFSGPRVRTFDAVAFNLWGAKKRRVVYEVKVNRADFQRELDDPTKREAAESWATETFFATPTGLLRVDEIPEGWGLVEVSDKGKIRTKKKAMQRHAGPVSNSLLCSIVRAATGAAGGESAEKALDRRRRLAAWRYHGRELTLDELIELAEETLCTKVEDRIRDCLRGAVQEELMSAKVLEALQFRSEIRRVCGWHMTTVNDLRDWLKARVGNPMGHLPSGALESMKSARSSLDMAILLAEEGS